jgi:hypothetical protein
MLTHIETLKLKAIFSAQGNGNLPPYLGSTIRGVLGHCLRDFVCTYPGLRCQDCSLSSSCAYALHFCSPGNEAGAVNPYVLNVNTRGKTVWESGDICEMEITLIGETAKQSGLFVDALQEMGNRGWGASRIPFRLEQVMDPLRDTLIWSGGKTWLRNCTPQPMPWKERGAQSIVVRFHTPVRVMISKKLCRSLSFESIVQSLSRRLALLSHAYTGYQLQWAEEEMLQAARAVKTVEEDWKYVDFQRYSMNQPDNKLSLGAIEGWARYEGDLTSFTPLLTAGQLIHVGKNATIGFGAYSVIYDR